MHRTRHGAGVLSRDPGAPWVLWGSVLSPFALKVEAVLRFHDLPYRWHPAQAGPVAAQRSRRRRLAVVKGRLPVVGRERGELDEFPQVPFLFGPAGENGVDSSSIALWLDDEERRSGQGRPPLLPTGDPALGFVVRLIDEALDEIGLYLVHHNRWVVAARDNDAGARLAREFRPLLGPGAALLQHGFPARQVRRLPYLFSCADSAVDDFDDLPRRLRPPARDGFPPTHALLEQAFAELLAAIEPVLSARPFLLGERFSLADASLYGQLGMNRSDPAACAWIRRDAPATAAWLDRLAAGDFAGHRDAAALALDPSLTPLLEWINRCFVPLMQQNHDAWVWHRGRGETLFNERGFDANRGTYDGTLLGRPFRSGVKTFQVRVWRDLRRHWDGLATRDRARIAALLAGSSRLDRDGTAP